MLFRLNGSYEALEYGFEADAFTDMTGGLAEWYNPADLKIDDFYLIRAAYQSGAVIGCLSVVSNLGLNLAGYDSVGIGVGRDQFATDCSRIIM